MQKPNSLRAAIAAALPDLARDADRLAIHVEKGRIIAPPDGPGGFLWDYQLTLIITDCTAHPSLLFHTINQWLRLNQPELLAGQSHPGYGFEAEIIDPQTVDLMVTLHLTEQVTVAPREDGGVDLQHLAEPPLFPDDAPLTDPARTIAQLWAGTTRLI